MSYILFPVCLLSMRENEQGKIRERRRIELFYAVWLCRGNARKLDRRKKKMVTFLLVTNFLLK